MNPHGASLHLSLKGLPDLAKSPETSSGYRNMFGDAKEEQYTGFGRSEEGRRRNRQMLRWLAMRFSRPYWPLGDTDNVRVPSGYTYLAQFVIHDTVLSLAEFPDLRNGIIWARNYRSSRLVLDGIYGKGPDFDPLFYAACPATPQRTGFLRTGGSAGAAGSVRDLPRSPCPFSGKPRYSNVLIADARNDDHLIIAQLTTIFHLLHNAVYGKLSEIGKPASDDQTFALARKVVARVYRNIVFKDLLKRVLLPPIYDWYNDNGQDALYDTGDSRMPLEFSHAAARFGHFMVRDQYQLNDQLAGEDRAVKSILRQTSAGRPWAMPLTDKWLIDWATLFDKDRPAPLRARRFGPAIAPVLVSNDFFRDEEDPTWKPGKMGGLAYRDLIRGAESNLRSVRSIVQKLPVWVRELSPLVRDGEVNSSAIVAWLRSTPDEPDYIDCLAKDPPLLLFVLLEAAKTAWPDKKVNYGECLGAVGSFIVAEFLFGEYRRTHPLIEADQVSAEAAAAIFGEAPLDTMPKLIAEVSRLRDFAAVRPRFW